jgi:hypothetical protein
MLFIALIGMDQVMFSRHLDFVVTTVDCLNEPANWQTECYLDWHILLVYLIYVYEKTMIGAE